jgi:molybdate transport system substrate-binding protein
MLAHSPSIVAASAKVLKKLATLDMQVTFAPGIDVVGPLPAELQDSILVWVAGSPFVSEQPVAAKALIDFLADPEAAAVYKAKGFQPG